MTPQLANRILIVAIAIFVVVMLARVVISHLRYRRARRLHDEAFQRVRDALERPEPDFRAAMDTLIETLKRE